MSNANILFDSVFNHVRKNGTLVSEPKSCWGAYRWGHHFGGGVEVVALLEDEGYTKYLYVAGLLRVAENCADVIEFHKGDMNSVLTVARMLGLDF
jgi:hypothetical protein